MKLIIGIGNPEEKYKENRHNAGHMLVDFLKNSDLSFDYKVEKTNVFMNESGIAVKKLVDFYKVNKEDLYIAYDDLDISLGNYKIIKGKGPRQHNGVDSVEQSLRSDAFWHIRIGVDNRTSDARSVRAIGKEYVLEDFTQEEEEVLKTVFARICEDIHGKN